MNECDFCGEEFDYSPNSELQEYDLCVCDDCEDVAREQLTLSGDMEEEDPNVDDELFYNRYDF